MADIVLKCISYAKKRNSKPYFHMRISVLTQQLFIQFQLLSNCVICPLPSRLLLLHFI